MNVLGLSCGFASEEAEMAPGWPVSFSHDSAAALVADGVVMAAVEEERLNRVKHTNKFAERGIRACLATAGLAPADVDRVAFFFAEDDFDKDLGLLSCEHPDLVLRSTRELLVSRVSGALGLDLDPGRVVFVRHHSAHACAAYFNAGYPDALVVVMDGSGEEESVSLMSARGTDLELVRRFDVSQSLGHLYRTAIQLLGYSLFDEYKVMGLAPYGDPTTYRARFRELYDLAPDGGYSLDVATVLPHFLRAGFRPRRRGEAFTRAHRDFAAALQETLESIACHVIDGGRRLTGHRRLCLGGGVALNCTMNGRILRSAMFDEVFVDPAAHDAGTAVGAAHHVCLSEAPERFAPRRLRHVFLGPPAGSDDEIEACLRRWGGHVEARRVDDPSLEAARLLAAGRVIAWVQGRSEFGPRALGNRSILADPRPAGNRDRINALIKRREPYRPLAPSVLAERAGELFECRDAAVLEYMVAAVPVRPEKRELLAAVTHVDGSARVQVVRRDVNRPFWELIAGFESLTGVPAVLNTSLNNEAEPIVQSADDAVVCLLTMPLDALVVGPFVVARRAADPAEHGRLLVDLPAQVRLEWARDVRLEAGDPGGHALAYRLTGGRRTAVSERLGALLRERDLPAPVHDLLRGAPSDERGGLLEELLRLWESRFVRLFPPAPGR